MPTRRNRFILVMGGARSGKSRFAVGLAKRLGRRIVYLATGAATDEEMRARIARHRAQRPRAWRTIESAEDPARAIARLTGAVDGLLMDCLTMHVSTRLVRGDTDRAIERHIRRLCETLRRVRCPVILVTNEVGTGVVPPSALGRRFRDVAGVANQIAAGAADDVYLLVAGIPLQIKTGA
jgi:adenosylcobinamide kinase/adenosylcobinamide-phosphate guanylyltransferase